MPAGQSLSRCAALAAVLALVLPVAGAASPSSYVLPGSHVFPEGIASERGTDAFFVGSLADGSVFRGKLGRATTRVFLAAGSNGRKTAAGMKVDRHGRLFVVSGSSGRVFVYETGSGALVRRFSTRYAKKQFLNDVAIAPNGDAFVTDSFRPMLYRIRAKAVRPAGGTARLDQWLDLRGTAISYVRGDVNLNGIAASGDGRFLVVAQPSVGKLFRIRIATKSVVEIHVGASIPADGLQLEGHVLYAVSRPQIVAIRLAPGLASGTVVSRTTMPFAFPTTIAIARHRMLVVDSQLDRRRQGKPPALPFKVASIPIPPH